MDQSEHLPHKFVTVLRRQRAVAISDAHVVRPGLPERSPPT